MTLIKKPFVIVLMTVFAAPLIAAENLKDPTKPWRPDPSSLELTDLPELSGGGGIGSSLGSSSNRETPSMSAATSLSLTAIKYRKLQRSRTAIINGELLRIGEKIAGSTVQDIQKNYITLLQGNKRVKITLFDTSVVKTN